MTITEFVKEHKISISNEYADFNPNMEDSDNMDNWKSTLKMGKKQMTVFFSKGTGHEGKEPDVVDILDCLIIDSSAMELTFEDFCSEFGYDTDSRKAERTFKACSQNASKLFKFLYREKFEQLKECEEE